MNQNLRALLWAVVIATATLSAEGQVPLAINEIDYDQPGTDFAEFIEIYNWGDSEIDLSDFEIELVNGAGGTAVVYQTISLTGLLASGDYYVLCVDAGTTPNCDLATLSQVQNGAPDAVGLQSIPLAMLVDTVSYEGDTLGYTESSGAGLEDPGTTGSDGLGISRLPDGSDTNTNNIDFSTRCSTPGEANSTETGNCLVVPGVVEIFEIQGSGLVSPFSGATVTTEDNLVTAVGPSGFFAQTPDARDDADPATSNGIYVFTDAAPAVQVGDQVDLTGPIEEYFEFTEFASGTNVSIDSTGNPLPQVITFDSTTPSPDPATPADVLERYEGMRITLPIGRTTAATDGFGESWLVAGDPLPLGNPERTFREPGIAFPGLPGLPVWDGNPQVMKIDPEALGEPPFTAFADHDVNADGNLAFAFGEYIIWPTSYTVDTTVDAPGPVRPAEAREFTVATQNLLRFFDDQDDPNINEPVLTPQEFQDRLTKTSLWVRTVLNAPDIVAVQEVENLNVVASLAAQLALDDPALVYSAHLIEGNDIGGIDVGYLTRDSRVQVNFLDQFGEDLLLSFDGSLLYDRPPLVLEATVDSPTTDPIDITVINVHQRSLGGIEGTSATRVKIKRLEQAAELAGLIQQLQTDSPAIHLLVTGDFNAFEFTDGYVDVMGQITGDLDPLGDEIGTTDVVDPDLLNWTRRVTPAERYSFVYEGNAQALDHLLTSSALGPRVRAVQFARGNADVPESFESDPATALRTSDHDGLVVFLVAPGPIFSDGFESGDTSAWSSTVP